MSQFPTKLDSDADLPRVDNNITEMGTEAINALRAAVFALEGTLGAGVQGSASTLATRLNAVLNPDGTFKSSALVAAGLIALPITNAMVGSTAGILESKLNLDVATQVLQNQIDSNDIDILALQNAANSILANFAAHVAGTSFRHDGYAIYLDSNSTSITPIDFAPFTATTVTQAIYALKNDYLNHKNGSAAHQAKNISVDPTNFTKLTGTNAQTTFEQVDQLSETELIDHRDDLHANGFANWANNSDGYNASRQFVPSTFGTYMTAFIDTSLKNIQFPGQNLALLGVKPGDVVAINSPSTLNGFYAIDDVGARASIGSLAALQADQLEIVETFADDGYVSAAIFAQSSINTFKANMAPTIHQSDIRVDSIQVARPNAAKIVSLGFNSKFINGSGSLVIEVGVGSGLSRTISISNLNLNRNLAPVSTVTIDTVIERLNYVFQNRADGYAFPVAAYRVGDELCLSHNWDESNDFYIKISSASTSSILYSLGLDASGANAVDVKIHPTQTAHFYVNGVKFKATATILDTKANIVGQTFTLPGGENPLDKGIKVGHLVHLQDHPITSERGTYFITAVTSSTITIHKNVGITTASNINIKILHDSIPLDENQNYNKQTIFEIFFDSQGRGGYNARLESENNISNLKITDISDNFSVSNTTYSLSSTLLAGGGKAITLQSGLAQIIPQDYNGNIKITDSSNIEFLTLKVANALGTGTNLVSIFEHINEEENLEVCSVHFDGLLTLSDITDKRLFGTTGLDEIREDVIESLIELPIKELHSNGIIYGFDIEINNYTSSESITNFGTNVYGILLRGGTAYVDGARVVVPTTPVFFPFTTANYVVAVNPVGSLVTLNVGNSSTDGYYSISEIIDGYAGALAPVALVTHSGIGVTPITSKDIRYFINNISEKIDFILDTSNRNIGTFASYDAAETYINNYPFNEKFTLKIISSNSLYNITTSAGSKDISLEIYGSIGSLTVNSNVRVISPSYKRSTAHIQSVQLNSGCTTFYMENIHVAGAFGASSSNTEIVFKSSILDGAVNISAAANVILDSVTISNSASLTLTTTATLIKDSKISITPGITIGSTSRILNTLFNSSAATLASTAVSNSAAIFIFEDCQFDGSNGGQSITINCATQLLGCIFSNLTLSSGAIVNPSSGTGYTTSVKNGYFTNITLSGTGKIITGSQTRPSELINSRFDSVTFGTAETITATEVFGNTFNAAGAGPVVGLVGFEARVVKNSDIGVVQYSSVSGTNVINEISDNIFTGTTLGFNINDNVGVSSSAKKLIISNNILPNKILLTANSKNRAILSNVFTGTTGIDFGALNSTGTSIVISNNIFDTSSTYFAFSNPVGGVSIKDNLFTATVPAATSALQISSGFSFSNNTLLDTSHIVEFIGSGAVQNVSIQNNISLGTLQFSGSFDRAIISGNRVSILDLLSGTTLTSTEIANNSIDTLKAISTTFTDVIFASNDVFAYSGVNGLNGIVNITWKDSTINNNKFITTTITHITCFNATSAYSNLTISNNIFGASTSGGVSLRADTSVKGVIFSNNNLKGGTLKIELNGSSLTSGTPILVEESVFESNRDLIFSFIAGTDTVIIANNDCIEAGSTAHKFAGIDVLLSGTTLLGTTIAGNKFVNVEIKPSTANQNIISANYIEGSLTVFDIVAVSQSITNSTFANNIISGTFTITGSNTSAVNRNFDQCSVINNNLSSLSIYPTGATGSTYSVTDTSIIGNQVSGDIVFLSSSGAIYSGASINRVKVSNNTAANLTFANANILSYSISNTNISNNNLTGVIGLTIGNQGSSFPVDLSTTTISGNNLVNLIGEVAIFSQCNIVNNIVTTAINIVGTTSSWTNIITNFNNVSSGITYNAGANRMTGMIFNGNKTINSLTLSATSASTSNFVVNGNTIGSSFNCLGLTNASVCVIADNFCSNTLSTPINLSDSTITGNICGTGTLDFGTSLINSNVSDNIVLANFAQMPTTITNVNFHNNIIGSTTSHHLDISSATSISNLNLSYNIIAGTLKLPDNTVFTTGVGQSKFFCNFAHQWTCPNVGTSITTATDGNIIFPWGNTAATAASGVTFNGATATATSSANNIASGAGITT